MDEWLITIIATILALGLLFLTTKKKQKRISGETTTKDQKIFTFYKNLFMKSGKISIANYGKEYRILLIRYMAILLVGFGIIFLGGISQTNDLPFEVFIIIFIGSILVAIFIVICTIMALLNYYKKDNHLAKDIEITTENLIVKLYDNKVISIPVSDIRNGKYIVNFNPVTGTNYYLTIVNNENNEKYEFMLFWLALGNRISFSKLTYEIIKENLK